MEFLMTYGWALLATVVVMIIFFEIGVFSNSKLALVCLSAPPFLCGNPVMSSSGALTIRLGYLGQQKITLTGLACNVTPATKSPSVESYNLTLSSGQSLNLTFQCPLGGEKIVGTQIPVYLYLYYDQPGASGLEANYAKGIVSVNYISLLWNVTQWTPSSNSVDIPPYSDLAADPLDPVGTVAVGNQTVWPSFIANGAEGWNYGTDYHYHDIYNGIEAGLFPEAPLSLDNAPCGAPYDSHGFTAVTNAMLSGYYTFNALTDDGTQIFYREGNGAWTGVFPQGSCTGSSWCPQPPTSYQETVDFSPGVYQIAVDYVDSCDPAGISAVLISPPPSPG
jgi:hypothetical protein